LNKLIDVATLVALLAVFQIGTNYSSGQTNNSTASQLPNPLDSNMTYIVIFGNKSIGNIDNGPQEAPPAQIANLYVGPLDYAPTGAPMIGNSWASFARSM
jgi:hypothetical protein